jgi:hypothetical protein
MSKISFVNVGLHGHVNPTLPVIAELMGRGHTVTYHADAGFEDQVVAAAPRSAPIGPSTPDAPARPRRSRTSARPPTCRRRSYLDRTTDKIVRIIRSKLERVHDPTE